ncbi:MAG: acetyltransferase [Desulfobulbaceae bacterium]|nr:acetyltransferase [Desulfobulbaceae bacterium]
MDCIDVFNGDADGICALHQLRLAVPQIEARLITGVKRDINLLAKLNRINKAKITVLDVSLDKNRADLERLIEEGHQVIYIDHHFSGDIPDSDMLETHLDPSAKVCTSVIVDSMLEGRYRKWAMVGAFGDNLDETAYDLAKGIGLSAKDVDALQELGVLLNYNGYGADIQDLFYHPATLYEHVSDFEDPLRFYAESDVLATLRRGYKDDLIKAAAYSPMYEDDAGRIFRFPDEAWARRVSGVYANILTREMPDKAHGMLTANADTSLRISVRAPLNRRFGADELCRQFPTGGGRSAAAGVNQLPQEMLADFISAFSKQFSK